MLNISGASGTVTLFTGQSGGTYHLNLSASHLSTSPSQDPHIRTAIQNCTHTALPCPQHSCLLLPPPLLLPKFGADLRAMLGEDATGVDKVASCSVSTPFAKIELPVRAQLSQPDQLHDLAAPAHAATKCQSIIGSWNKHACDG